MTTLFGSSLILFMMAVTQSVSQFSVEIVDVSKGMRKPKIRCEATGATFGADVATFSFGKEALGCAMVTKPEDACGKVEYTPLNSTMCRDNFFAIVPRGPCEYSEKAFNVQNASPNPFSAIIIFNEKGQAPIDMGGGKHKDEIAIPVVMVSYSCMLDIVHVYNASEGFMVQIKISPGYYDLFRYLIPFVVVVGFCFIVLIASLVFRLCRERRRIARKRLSKRNLRKIPTKKYRKGDTPETCAICLDDFIEGEKLRVLPCRHTYHCTCIDPWLTQNRKVCPMCKRRVGAKNSDSESDTEQPSTQQPSTSNSVAELIPSRLLRSPSSNVDASTPPHSSNTTNVMAEVHNEHPSRGSTENLVPEDFSHYEYSETQEDAEEEPTLSQSIKKRFKTLFNGAPPGAERIPDDDEHDEEMGQVNPGFNGSRSSLSAEAGPSSVSGSSSHYVSNVTTEQQDQTSPVPPAEAPLDLL